MVYIAIGACGFLVAWFFDHPCIVRIRWARLTIGVVAICLLVYSLVMAAAQPDRFRFPLPVSAAGWAFTGIFFLFFVYSVFIEIPFTQAWLSKGARMGTMKTGTYAMTRHPGLIWSALALLSLVLATGSKVLAWASPVWILMDLTWVYIQDRFYFPRTIPGYEQYKKEVPMLLPTVGSIRNCARTLRQHALGQLQEDQK